MKTESLCYFPSVSWLKLKQQIFQVNTCTTTVFVNMTYVGQALSQFVIKSSRLLTVASLGSSDAL